MKFLPVAAISVFLATALRTFAGPEIASESTGVLDAPRFEMALESAYLLGVFGNPNSYDHYFGLNFGSRYNFVRPGTRFVLYISAGLGLGWIDSHPGIPGAQGQDFTFNILTAAGISYKMNDHWKLNAGILYEHLSNGGQTDPNPSLNLLGPQIGLNYSF